MTATKDVADWTILAPLLGVSAATVKRIKAKELEPLYQQKEIIEKWLQLGTASWAILVSALRDELVGKVAVADEIAKQHPIKDGMISEQPDTGDIVNGNSDPDETVTECPDTQERFNNDLFRENSNTNRIVSEHPICKSVLL